MHYGDGAQMKTIAFYNTKGGCGKSTIADEFLFHLERENRVWQYVDFDGQGGLSHSAGPQARAKITVMDMPGQPTEQDAEALRHSDVITIPMINSAKNIAATAEALSLVKDVSPTARVVLVVNKYVARTRVDREFIQAELWDWLHELRDDGKLPAIAAVTLLPDSTVVRSADKAGVSVMAYDSRSSVARAMDVLCTVLLAATDEDDDQFRSTLDDMADSEWLLPMDKLEG